MNINNYNMNFNNIKNYWLIKMKINNTYKNVLISKDKILKIPKMKQIN